MSERCSECQRRPARRRGLCVYCVRAADDERYTVRVETKKRRAAVQRQQARRERQGRLDELRREWHREPRSKTLLAWAFQQHKMNPTPAEDLERRAALEALIERQQREQQRSHVGWGERVGSALAWFSLDALMWPNAESETYKDVLVASSDPFEPQVWLEAKLLDELVGDRSMAEIRRMSDNELESLRRRLGEAGFGTRVQAKERERLRPIPRHRGSGPAPTFERMASRRRRRRDQIALMTGKRTSRKPRRRWNRETVVFDWKAAA